MNEVDATRLVTQMRLTGITDWEAICVLSMAQEAGITGFGTWLDYACCAVDLLSMGAKPELIVRVPPTEWFKLNSIWSAARSVK